jgi:BirA family biotin operon repressor/biotin-[acetyl-CoA-carboxylase] ligase
VAVHQTVSSFFNQNNHGSLSQALSIKWPNDIYWQDKKIAGILIENAIIGGELKYSIAGIGLNVNQTQFVSNAPNPISMSRISGVEYNMDTVMNVLMDKIHELQTLPSEDVWAYYRAHLYRREGEWLFAEREVSITPSRILTDKPQNAFMASIEAITPNGELVLHTHAGTRTYHFKEIQFIL